MKTLIKATKPKELYKKSKTYRNIIDIIFICAILIFVLIAVMGYLYDNIIYVIPIISAIGGIGCLIISHRYNNKYSKDMVVS